MKKVLVTGATGFIGRHSLRPLQARGYEVHAMYFDFPLEDAPGVIWHQANILDGDSVRSLCESINASHLLHFAWYVNPKDYKISSENERWAAATLSLLKAFRACGCVRAVLAGSCIEYDWSAAEDSYSEGMAAKNQPTAYGRAKNETRRLAEAFSKENGLNLAWGRIFFLYGPHEARERLVPHVITTLLKGTPALLTSCEQIRDYMYVKDVADAFASIADSDVTGAINVCSGNAYSVKEVVLCIARLIGKPDLLRFNVRPDRDEPKRIVGNIQRLENEVGWRPHYSLERGIKETVGWGGSRPAK